MTPTELAEAQLIAYNAQDIEAFVAVYAEDIAIFRLPGGEPTLLGREAMHSRYDALFKEFPERRAEILSRKSVGNFVIDHERVTNEPGGEATEVFAIYEAREGLIQNVWFAG